MEAPRREIVLPRAAYLGAALVFGGDVVYWRRDILPPIFLAFSLAYILDPVVDWLEAWHVLRPAGIALVLGRALGTIGLFLVLVLPGIATDIAGVIQELPKQLPVFSAMSEDSHWNLQCSQVHSCSAATRLLCPSAGTRADPAKNRPLSSDRQTARCLGRDPLGGQDPCPE